MSEQYGIDIGKEYILLTHEEIRQGFITFGKFLLKKEEEMQEIFEEETP